MHIVLRGWTAVFYIFGHEKSKNGPTSKKKVPVSSLSSYLPKKNIFVKIGQLGQKQGSFKYTPTLILYHQKCGAEAPFFYVFGHKKSKNGPTSKKKGTSVFVKFIPSKKINFRENWAIRSKAEVVQIYSHLIFVRSKKLPSKMGLKRHGRLKPL